MDTTLVEARVHPRLRSNWHRPARIETRLSATVLFRPRLSMSTSRSLLLLGFATHADSWSTVMTNALGCRSIPVSLWHVITNVIAWWPLAYHVDINRRVPCTAFLYATKVQYLVSYWDNINVVGNGHRACWSTVMDVAPRSSENSEMNLSAAELFRPSEFRYPLLVPSCWNLNCASFSTGVNIGVVLIVNRLLTFVTREDS